MARSDVTGFFSDTPTAASTLSLRSLQSAVFWLDDPARPAAMAPLGGRIVCDLLVVGGGFSGLWSALLAKEADPGRDVVLLEASRIADAATGRNGGFVSPSLTHGIRNGAQRWPADLGTLLRLGHENLDAIEATIARLGIDCDFRRSGEITVAVQDYQVGELREAAQCAAGYGEAVDFLDGERMRARVHSASYLGASTDQAVALVNPARLAWGLLEACQASGVRVFEHSPVLGLTDDGSEVTATTAQGRVVARRVAVATNAFPAIVRQAAKYVVPVYDYVLMTEPLSVGQWSSIGWHGREGIGDAGNQFHYYRPTADGRILWGGYDAVYHRGNGFGTEFEFDPGSFARIARHFFQTFPQLDGLSFSHGWGGAIDTCSRFSPFWGTTHRGKTAYVAGYTGLGVGSSRFGAQVILDLLSGAATERTELAMVRSKPIPFPPEPIRSLGINWTTRSLAAADRNGGRRNLWLRTLDRVGLGFDS